MTVPIFFPKTSKSKNAWTCNMKCSCALSIASWSWLLSTRIWREMFVSYCAIYCRQQSLNLGCTVDLGTGTGLWAIQFADEHPRANVIGTDLSAMQPTLVPPNLKFEVDDFEAPWNWPQKFDLIHGRMLNCSFADGKRLFQQAYDALKPGGWIEFQDAYMPIRSDDGTLDGTRFEQWTGKFADAMAKIGRDATAPDRYDQCAREVGFVNVARVDYRWPQNPWPKDPLLKELGTWHMINTLDGLHGFSVRPFTAILGMSLEEVELFLVEVKKDIMNRRIHSYWPM
jgi:SAM-dependent methyltransferase